MSRLRPARIPAPQWLPGGHAQTIWPKLFSRLHHGAPPPLWRERWDTPDGDFVDCDWLEEPAHAQVEKDERPLLVLFHGLEGSSASHYCQAFASHAQRLGWACALPHFRGCSGELNRAPRAYHSGDHAEIGWMLEQARTRHQGPLLAVGVSLGGNALLRWAQEAGEAAGQTVRALAAVSAPLDLEAASVAIGQGLNKAIYTRYFLRSMVPKALRQLQQHPGLFDAERAAQIQSLYEFDDLITAPLHGFKDAMDYYARASAKPGLAKLRVPSLILNARNDPFVPAHSLPGRQAYGPAPITLWQPAHGGHVGFPTGRWPGHALGLPDSVCAWLTQFL